MINEQPENNFRAVGKFLSRLARQLNEIDTPTKYQHRRHPNFVVVQSMSEAAIQDGRSRQSKNKHSRCLPSEITNSSDNDKSESQYSSQSSKQVDYGTPPDTRVQSFEDYDWEQDRMIKYRINDKGGIGPK